MKTFLQLLFAVLLGLFLTPADAQAYLDPGTGSMLLQGALAMFFGSMFFLRQQWGVVLAWFKGGAEPTSESDT